MILINYAYSAEVKTLKKLVDKANLGKKVSWFCWISTKPVDSFLRPARQPQWQLALAGGNCPSLDGGQKSKPELILNVGFAGGLNPKLNLGQVVLINKIFVENKRRLEKSKIDSVAYAVAQNFVNRQKIAEASLFTSKNEIINSLLNEKLRLKTKADAVDMEGFHLFKYAQEQKIPFLSFKIISDNANQETWETIKKNGEDYSKVLGQTVFDFIRFFMTKNTKH